MRYTSHTYNTIDKPLLKSSYLGNVLTTISDIKLPVDTNHDGTIDRYVADIRSATDYAAFGAPMDGRTFSSGTSVNGFNGKRKDDETFGAGNEYDYGMRIYDPRLGRFFSVDPLSKKYPELSTYQFASNTPIMASDLNGLEANVEVKWDGKTTPVITLVVYIQVENKSKYLQDQISQYNVKGVQQIEDSYKGTVSIQGVEFKVQTDVYITEGPKKFSLTYKDLGSDYSPYEGVLGEADEIGNTQRNNSDIYVGMGQNEPAGVGITIAHEKGHELSLTHTKKLQNLLNPKSDGSGNQTDITPKQLKQIINNTLNEQEDKGVKNQLKDIIKGVKEQKKNENKEKEK